MPMTPFHFGPGVLIKSGTPKQFSWSMFVLVNIAIDLEPVTYYLLSGDPAHGYLHTLLAATLLALICAYYGKPLCETALRFWNLKMSARQALWLRVNSTMTLRVATLSALVGTWSHIVLDCLMHPDVMPFWPVSRSNDLSGVIDMNVLHILCVLSGVWGVLRLVTRRWDEITLTTSLEAAGNAESFPIRAASRVARFSAGFARTLTGFLVIGFLLHALIGELSNDATRTTQFDPKVWRQAAILAYSEDNLRYYMIKDALHILNETRPNYQDTLALLGNPMSAPETEWLTYWAGSPGAIIRKRQLVVRFDKDGRFRSAYIDMD